MSESIEVPTTKLVPDNSLWPRLGFDQERCALFMDLYGSGGRAALPPVLVVPLGDGSYLVPDGWHRVSAQASLGWKTVEALPQAVPEGVDPKRFAYELALKTSVASSKPLTRLERQRAVARCIELDPSRSDREIGRLCGLAHTTVSRLRRGGRVSREVEPGEDRIVFTTAQELASRLFRGMEKVWEARGFGILDSFLGDRTAERLADALANAYADKALERAQTYRRWLDAAIARLEGSAS